MCQSVSDPNNPSNRASVLDNKLIKFGHLCRCQLPVISTAVVLKSGISIPFILSVLQRNASPYYRERLHQTAENVKNGHNLGHSLQLTGLNFPDREMIQDIRIYADLNRFNETLEYLDKEWLEDSKEKIQRQSVLIRNGLL